MVPIFSDADHQNESWLVIVDGTEQAVEEVLFDTMYRHKTFTARKDRSLSNEVDGYAWIELKFASFPRGGSNRFPDQLTLLPMLGVRDEVKLPIRDPRRFGSSLETIQSMMGTTVVSRVPPPQPEDYSMEETAITAFLDTANRWWKLIYHAPPDDELTTAFEKYMRGVDLGHVGTTQRTNFLTWSSFFGEGAASERGVWCHQFI